MSDSGATLLFLSRPQVSSLLDDGDLVAALDAACRAQARGEARGPAAAALPAWGGTFHAKGAALAGRAVFKVNGNFVGNPERHGLPTIQGLIVLADAERGTPLAVMDSIEITARRTAAATALAARLLAPAPARALIVGCGVQGWAHARALAHAIPPAEIVLFDLVADRADALARRVERELGIAARRASDLEAAARAATLLVTCTTARRPVLGADCIAPGAFVAAVGADNPDKRELEPEILRRARVVVDDLEQCAASGELRHALAAGLLRREDVAAALHDVVAERLAVRRSPADVVVFDSTGVALEDLAAASLVYDRALATGIGARFDLAA